LRHRYRDVCAVPNYLEPTTNAARGDIFYVTKVDTRIEGPWFDKDVVKTLTRQLRVFVTKEMYPWQKQILDIVGKVDDRHINIVFDHIGNCGKSMFSEYLEFHE
jgi:hypothetical protein